ncbi:MAG: tRNA (adenosine(37)-N6)-dimethylallyltransferase MiaA, partial [Bacilli bacterium]
MIIAVVGPTGVGKTKMAVALAKKYGAQIISCDSMQVYKKLDIGTAKVTAKEKESIIHHMIDICDVNADYSVYNYQKDARAILNKLVASNINVIIVGGTGLYLKALLYNYEFKNIEEKRSFSEFTNEELYEMVLKINPNNDIHVNNRQRLESYLKNHNKDDGIKKNSELLYNTVFIGLTMPREKLYNVIDSRVDEMIKGGLLKEAKSLYDNNTSGKSIKTAIAYKELYEYFDGNLSLDGAVDLIKKRSRNYAKRQYTWFKNQMNVKWFNVLLNDF